MLALDAPCSGLTARTADAGYISTSLPIGKGEQPWQRASGRKSWPGNCVPGPTKEFRKAHSGRE